MQKLHRAPRLIGYRTEAELTSRVRRFWRPRLLLYILLLLLSLGLFGYLQYSRLGFSVTLHREGNQVFTVDANEMVVNMFRLQIQNRSGKALQFDLTAVSPTELQLQVPGDQVILEAGDKKTVHILLKLPAQDFLGGIRDVMFQMKSSQGQISTLGGRMIGPMTGSVP